MVGFLRLDRFFASVTNLCKHSLSGSVLSHGTWKSSLIICSRLTGQSIGGLRVQVWERAYTCAWVWDCMNVDVCERGSVQGGSVPECSPGGRCGGEVGLQQHRVPSMRMALHPPLSYLGLDPPGSRWPGSFAPGSNCLSAILLLFGLFTGMSTGEVISWVRWGGGDGGRSWTFWLKLGEKIISGSAYK